MGGEQYGINQTTLMLIPLSRKYRYQDRHSKSIVPLALENSFCDKMNCKAPVQRRRGQCQSAIPPLCLV